MIKNLLLYILVCVVFILVFSVGCLNPVESRGAVEATPIPSVTAAPTVEEQNKTYSIGIQVNVPETASEAKGLGVSSVSVTVKQNYEVVNTLTVTYDAVLNAFVGGIDGMLPGEYFLMGEAKDSSGNIIYSGQQVVTVTDSSVACRLVLIGEAGAFRINANWYLNGYVDRLRAYAVRSTFPIIEKEKHVIDSNGTSDSIYLVNLTQGSWSITVEGYKGDELYFQKKVSNTVQTNTVTDVNVTLDQKKITSVFFDDSNITSYPATISLSCDTQGADIYYKTSYYSTPGNPSTSSTKYTGPITVTRKTFFSVIAYKYGLGYSDANSTMYVVDLPKPWANVLNYSLYKKMIYLHVDNNITGYALKYTTDGSDPATSSTAQSYSNYLIVDHTTDFRVIATHSYYNPSEIFETTVTVDNSPFYNSKGGDYGKDRRVGHQTIMYNGYAYIIGGRDSAGYYHFPVYYAEVLDDNTTGTWEKAADLDYGRTNFEAIVSNGYIYLIGGFQSFTSDSVKYAKINSDGTLGVWNETTALPQPLQGLQGVEYNGYIYITGGYNDTDHVNSVYYSKINDDGSLGEWKVNTSFTTPRREHCLSEYNGYLYINGGYNSDDGVLGDVQYAKIENNGTIGAWNYTNAMPNTIFRGTAGVYNGYFYISGGQISTGGTLDNSAYFAPIEDNGSIGNWALGGQYSTSRFYHSLNIYNSSFYQYGGGNRYNYYSSSTYVNFDIPRGEFYTKQCDPPIIKSAGGAYLTAQNVEIVPQIQNQNATIRYTLDGTVPTESKGFDYTGPVAVTQHGTTLTAAAFLPGHKPSKPVKRTYYLRKDTGLILSDTLVLLNYYKPETLTNQSEKWFNFTIDTSGNYSIGWADSSQGTGSETVDITVTLYDGSRASVLGGVDKTDSGYTVNPGVTLPPGEYFIKVETLSGSPATGSFKIKVY